MRKPLHLIWIFCIVSSFIFAGCTQTEPSDTPIPPETQSAPSETPGTEGIEGLSGVVSKTKKAIEAGNFAKAKQEFDQFEQIWKTVEDGIKEKSPESYESIEESLDRVTLELKKSAPKTTQIFSDLQALDQTLEKVKKL